MSQEDIDKIIMNYHKSFTALSEIGTTDNIPKELKQLTINALSLS